MENKIEEVDNRRKYLLGGIIVILILGIGFWEYNLRTLCRERISYIPESHLQKESVYKYGYPYGEYFPTLSEAMSYCVSKNREYNIENFKCSMLGC